jgi:flavin-dependent dehydrogenase
MVIDDSLMPAADTESTDYDVIIAGGAFSGSALALLLKRARPQTRILIIEKSEIFDRKVGESTSEVSGCFLTRVLGMSNYLSCHQFQKHGLRMWFNAEDNMDAGRCSEIGPFAQARLPTFQLDRSKLDEHLLDTCRKEGIDVIRPATIKSMETAGAGKNVVTLKHEGETRTLRAGWIADCSGKAALLARARGTWRSLDAHPVHSMWVRFRNVRCLDSMEAIRMAPRLGEQRTSAARGSATNHLMGHGWWAWIIPLSNGDFSAGVTWDERLFTPPKDGPIGLRVKQHLLTHPIGKLMFEDAEPVENDSRIYKNLPYHSTEVAGDGWVIAGDAAGFMDPLYSQGLDYCSHSTYCAHKLLLKGLDKTEPMDAPLAMHNRQFTESYERWFHGIYRNKYQYLGDADLMRAAFLMDIAAYFVGPVRLVYHWTDAEFSKMPYDGAVGAFFGRFMGFYNHRLETIARKRLAAGNYGKHNLDQRYFIRRPFEASTKSFRHLFDGIRAWMKLEVECAFTRPTEAMAPAMPQPRPQLSAS